MPCYEVCVDRRTAMKGKYVCEAEAMASVVSSLDNWNLGTKVQRYTMTKVPVKIQHRVVVASMRAARDSMDVIVLGSGRYFWRLSGNFLSSQGSTAKRCTHNQISSVDNIMTSTKPVEH